MNEEPFQNRENFSASAKKVYAPYVLMRSQEVLEGKTQLTIPGDLRTLIENTYAPREETGWYAELKKQLENEIEKLKRFADFDASKASCVHPDTEAATRYSEEETVEVLLLKEMRNGSLLPFGTDEWIQIPPQNASRKERALCARQLNRYLVRVRISQAPAWEAFPLHELKHVLYVGSDGDRPLRAAFVGTCGELLTREKNPAKPDAPIKMIPQKHLKEIRSLNYLKNLGYWCEYE